ncbi:unnamed protein product [Chilo suppressalis]|uniref:Endonuclease/exonuclease/phosphatase domain-containing protein n=1 Tax=Chilo suppressalis TaxID=168631 RepID=A0ABN8B8D5_CHISP|nr:unnamed protein product [Chilo suppressalis]
MGRNKVGKKRKKTEPDKDDPDGLQVDSTSSDSDEDGEESLRVPYYVTDYTRQYQEDSMNSEYVVFVESADTQGPIGTRDLLSLSNCLRRYIKGVKYLRSINKYKIGVYFEKPNLANALLNNKTFLNDNNLRAIIPASAAEITGIIRNVSTKYSNKKIFTLLSSFKKIISVRRFFKKVYNDGSGFSLQPTQTVAITFAASHLPDFVDLDGWRHSITTYIPPVKQCYRCLSTPRFNISKFTNLINELPKPVYIAGDFNAHHTIWGCHTVDARGRDILDSLENCDLILLNDAQATTVGTDTWRPNGLDLTMVSPVMALNCDWFVNDDPLGSYHLPTLTHIHISSYNQKQNHRIHVDSDSDNPHVYKNGDRDKRFVSPYPHSRKRRHFAVPWWNENCNKAVQNSKEAYIKFKNNSSQENYVNFKKISSPLSKIWQTMRKFNRSFIPPIKDEIPSWVNDFLRKYTPDFVEVAPFPSDLRLNSNSCDITNSTNDYLTSPFTLSELSAAIKSRKDTACGLDLISYKMLKKLDCNSIKKLLAIFNGLWENSLIPDNWKIDCLIPVIKPNKSKACADSYRPIALSSCMGKIFEQLLKHRLEFYKESNNLLPNNQFGFRRGRSARESIGCLHTDIQNALNDNNIMEINIVINRDLSCKYDVYNELNVWAEYIIDSCTPMDRRIIKMFPWRFMICTQKLAMA